MNNYWIYLDESGQFSETLSGSELIPQNFPSQIAGFAVSGKDIPPDEAKAYLERAYKVADAGNPWESVGDRLKKADFYPGGTQYDKILGAIVQDLHSRNAFGLRIVNSTRKEFCDRIEAHTSILAELVANFSLELFLKGEKDVAINIVHGSVFNKDGAEVITDADFKRRIKTVLGEIGKKRGLNWTSPESLGYSFEIGSGRQDPRLRLADFISNASHSDFKKPGPEAGKALQAFLGGHNWTYSPPELTFQISLLIESEHLDRAIIEIAERCVYSDKGGLLAAGLATLADRAVSALARSTFPNAILKSLYTHCQIVVEFKRDAGHGLELIDWLLANIYAPLTQKLKARAKEFSWFSFYLNTLGILAGNHRGALTIAEKKATDSFIYFSDIVGNAEHEQVILDHKVYMAVHYIDTFEFEKAIASAKVAADYYKNMNALRPDAAPGTFTELPKSKKRGEALGTMLQAQYYFALKTGGVFKAARETSEEAIKEFSEQNDLIRQYQYRAQLETFAGDFAAARKWLAKSLNIESDSNRDLIAEIIRLQGGYTQGFALLHWTRIGAKAHQHDNKPEWDDFVSAWKANRKWCQNNSWLNGAEVGFPVHGILRWEAYILGATGEIRPALEITTKLTAMVSANGTGPVLRTIALAALAEAESEKIKSYAEKWSNSCPDSFPALKGTMRCFATTPADAKKIAATIGY